MSDRILITGGAGFLGQHLARRLASEGHDVDILDIKAPGRGVPVQFIQSDLREWVTSARKRYDTVFHLAALVGGRKTIEDRPFSVYGNIEIDRAIFDYAVRRDCGRVVYMSSSAVYPVDRQRQVTDDPLTEKEVDTQRGPLRIPDYTYGWAKMSGEFIAGLAREKYGLPVVIYRPFSVYGPGQGSDYPIPAIVARTARKEDPLTIWGSGLQVRDFVYIDDFLAIVMGSYRTLPFAEPLNISTGRGVNFHEVGQTAATVAGYAPRIAADASQPAGVLCRVGSIAAIPERLRPRVSLREGLTKMFQHLSPRNRCSSILN